MSFRNGAAAAENPGYTDTAGKQQVPLPQAMTKSESFSDGRRLIADSTKKAAPSAWGSFEMAAL